VTSRLDLCIEALRLLARSSELEATRLMTAERIREFLAPATSNPAALRALLEELDNAVNLEAELRPREAHFGKGLGTTSPNGWQCSTLMKDDPHADRHI
jgi:hypothetical protein